MTKAITLIVPDLHHKWQMAEKIIDHVGADKIIFLGDYFDDFNDDPCCVKDTTDWLEASVSNPNRLHLFGNHDVHYAYPYRTFQCSGYAQWKYFIIHDTINPNVWNKLQWFTFLDDTWLLSHGGWHNLNVPKEIAAKHTNRKEFIAASEEYLNGEITNGFRNGANGVKSWIFNAGRARWGNQRVGGLIWCDYEREFYPIKGINQIVGHTPQQFGIKWNRLTEDGKVFHHPYNELVPTKEQLDNPNLSYNIDMDVHGNMHFGIWDGNKLTIQNYRDDL